MDEGQPALEGCGLRDQGKVHCLLHACGPEHCPTGAATGHDIAMVTEDRQSVRGDGAGGDVENSGKQLSRNSKPLSPTNSDYPTAKNFHL